MNERDLIFEQYKLIKEAEEQQSTMTVDAEGNKFWRLPDDKLHRVDGPAIEWANGAKEWWVNGKLHRVGGPAVEWANGDKWWHVNGKRHRVDGPAIEYANGDKWWYVNGELHREDGPAVEYANGDKEWWVNDILYNTPSDWAEAVLKLHNKPHDQKSIDRFLKPILSKGLNDLL